MESKIIPTRQEIIDAEMDERKNLTIKERNDFVEAGAGAGKTFSLITRIFYQLTKLNNPCLPKDIVAITFTNKAAEELRVRIVKRLQIPEKDPKEEERLKKRKQELLQTIDEMQISTIHKFCDNILRENAIQAGLSPDYQIIMDDDEKAKKQRTISKFFKNFSHSDWQKYQDFNDNKKVKEKICECFEGLITNVNHLTKSQVYTYTGLQKSEREIIQDLETAEENYFTALYDYFIDNEAELLLQAEEALFKLETGQTNKFTGYIRKPFVDLFKNFHDFQSVKEFTLALLDFSDKDIPIGKTYLKKTDEGKAVIEYYNAWQNAILEKDIYFITLFIDDGYRLYKLYLEDCDRDITHLSNNDLIYRTYKLLKDKINIRNKIRNKIKHLYIDEYQDTDSVQYQIANMIAEGREDCLYLVGDPKQSIYRFRGAEPDVFFETKKDYQKNKKTHDIYTLNINFRSNNKILEWVNSKYSISGQEIPLVSDTAYIYPEMLHADRNEIDLSLMQSNTLVGFHRFTSSKPEDVANLINEIKAHYKLRKSIKEMKDGKEVEVFKYDSNIEYKDIMLLFEGHKKMPPYIAALNNANIPSKIFGSSDFSETFALRTFINLFDVLNSNSNSNLAIAESVFQTIYPSKYIDKTIKESQDITSNIVNELRNKTHKMTAYGRAIYLIEHLDLLISEGEIVHSFELNTIKSKLHQMVEEVFAQGFINGSEIVEQFREYLDVAVERESSIEKDNDAVMVINLHKAKGLEKPIVIWVCTQKQNNNKKSSTFAEGKYYYSELISKLDKLGGVPEIDAIKNEEELEKRRLEYVAATRPGEAFIFCRDSDHKAGLFNNKNYDYQIDSLSEIELPGLEEMEVEETTNPDNYSPKDHTYTGGSKSKIDVTSPSSLESGTSETRDRLRREAGEINKGDRPCSNDVGTILHRALELFVKFGFDANKATELAMIENASVVEEEEKLKDFILTCVKAYIDYFKKVGFDQYEARAEYTFSYYDNNEINNGSIDLLLMKGDEYIIVDYKSDEAEFIKDDNVFEQTLKEKYEPQLEAYEKVVRHLFKNIKSLKKKIIYFRRYDRASKQIDVCSYEL